MTWFNKKIYLANEIRESAEDIPAHFEVGQDVWLHLFTENGESHQIPAIIAGISIGGMHEITYDLLFRIGDSDFYSRTNGFRGFITRPGEYIEQDGGLIEAVEHKPIKQNFLSIVSSSKRKK